MRWTLLVLAACSVALADEPPARRFEHDMIVRFHMHENFDLVRSVEKLLVRGKLDEAQNLASAIFRAPDEPGLAPFAPEAIEVRGRASAVATASSIEEALRAEAKLATACASCHAATGASPEFRSAAQPPPDKATIDARMARHVWATDRLWEGIIGDADDSWRAGLDVLAATPLPWKTFDKDRGLLGRRLQRLAEDGRKATREDRARAYGEMLVTCAACHSRH